LEDNLQFEMRTSIILALLLASTGCTQGQKEHPVTQDVPVNTNESIIENMDSDYSPTFTKAQLII
jgi:hypothetical protein